MFQNILSKYFFDFMQMFVQLNLLLKIKLKLIQSCLSYSREYKLPVEVDIFEDLFMTFSFAGFARGNVLSPRKMCFEILRKTF